MESTKDELVLIGTYDEAERSASKIRHHEERNLTAGTKVRRVGSQGSQAHKRG